MDATASQRIGNVRRVLLLVALILFAAAGCRGSKGTPGAAGAGAGSDPSSGSTVLTAQENLPGVVIEIVSVSGQSGAQGAYEVGDRIAVTFTVKKNDGSDLSASELDLGAIMVSGPSFNYQRVLARQSDLPTASVENADGSYTYSFAAAIPATYLAPLNDTASFGSGDGELQGEALLAGTYTVGIEAYKNYTVEGTTYRDVGNATKDFLFGSATSLESREVVGLDNCNRCHVTLQAHGGIRRDVKLCVLCHTSGAEDRNVSGVEGGTPGVSIDFRVMIHKIHNGSHLPSVLGVATNPDGSRNYSATPVPYRLVGFGNNVSDFSDVAFPVWPNLSFPMPRDQGYTGLTSGQKATEDAIRQGVTDCSKCHGDPDGAGPLAAPAQGDLVYSQPNRRACGSCHDDVDWSVRYVANFQTMPAQANDASCAVCHSTSGTALSIQDAHLHPLVNPAYNPGVNIDLTGLAEAGTNDGDGTIDPGEKVAVTFTVKDDTGADIAPSDLASISTVLSGPTTNRNLILNTSIPTGALSGSQPYTVNLPQPVVLELVGTATGSLGDVFTTSRAPLWNMAGAATTVLVRTATAGGSTTLTTDATALANYLEVGDTTGFARNDYLVLEDGVGGQEEYLQVALVDGSRLWVNSPLRNSHSSGSAAQEVTLTTKTVTTQYTVNAAAGQITEVAEFGAGNAVLVSYTSDFIMPSVYPPALNDSPDLTETSGKWTGKSIVDGTYTVGLWTSRNVVVALYGETQTYRAASPPASMEFLVGAATSLSGYSLISSGDNCDSCHNVVLFHGGGRRGFDTCILCHGSAGSEDRPRYTAANAPATTGLVIEFRNMLHKIHRGESLDKASTYTVVGFGASAYPNNFSASTYSDVVFPPLPDGVKQCSTCHGSSTAWKEPAARDHASQTDPTRVWEIACTSCHDSDAAAAHVGAQTFGGVESCSVCHGTGREFNVELMHKSR
jgi:OmcA/MtrC family decaheme c-type cytochrome